MWRERTLKIVLVLVGLLFTAMVYPLVLFVKQEPALFSMSPRRSWRSMLTSFGCEQIVQVRATKPTPRASDLPRSSLDL
jgi:hypothetical protein